MLIQQVVRRIENQTPSQQNRIKKFLHLKIVQGMWVYRMAVEMGCLFYDDNVAR